MGVPATELPPTCGYPTPRQPTGIVGDGGTTGDASADG